jgi:5'-AMP-activated protein kinase catalytic alpha subunit
MEYFHLKGVTHRDLKPENILLTKSGMIKIADFGLGNMFKNDEKLKTACGSPCYAAP